MIPFISLIKLKYESLYWNSVHKKRSWRLCFKRTGGIVLWVKADLIKVHRITKKQLAHSRTRSEGCEIQPFSWNGSKNTSRILTQLRLKSNISPTTAAWTSRNSRHGSRMHGAESKRSEWRPGLKDAQRSQWISFQARLYKHQPLPGNIQVRESAIHANVLCIMNNSAICMRVVISSTLVCTHEENDFKSSRLRFIYTQLNGYCRNNTKN